MWEQRRGYHSYCTPLFEYYRLQPNGCSHTLRNLHPKLTKVCKATKALRERQRRRSHFFVRSEQTNNLATLTVKVQQTFENTGRV